MGKINTYTKITLSVREEEPSGEFFSVTAHCFFVSRTMISLEIK